MPKLRTFKFTVFWRVLEQLPDFCRNTLCSKASSVFLCPFSLWKRLIKVFPKNEKTTNWNKLCVKVSVKWHFPFLGLKVFVIVLIYFCGLEVSSLCCPFLFVFFKCADRWKVFSQNQGQLLQCPNFQISCSYGDWVIYLVHKQNFPKTNISYPRE